jgi:plasmid replication initiation protein
MLQQETLFGLKLNEDYTVAAANDLIRGKQKMSEREAKLLMLAMAQVVNEDDDFKTYITTVSELAKFFGVTEPALRRDLEGICTDLLQRVVKIKTSKDDWDVFQWVNRATFKKGKLTLRLSDDIKPYMLDLANQGYFTKYQLKTIFTFKGYYAIRLYQLLKCETGLSDGYGGKDEWEFSLDELRDFFQTGKLYSGYKDATKDLLKKTIKTAIKELNASPYAYVWDFEEIRARTQGRPIQRIKFKALLFESQKQKDKMVEFIKKEEQQQQLTLNEVTADENN